MAKIEHLFATKIYTGMATGRSSRRLLEEVEAACRSVAAEDEAGQAWCRDNSYLGYTSYASLNDLTWRSPVLAELSKEVDEHVAVFVRDLDFDLGGRRLRLDSLWINILQSGGVHGSHIHPHSVISGTYYAKVPDGASAIKFEDPRLGLMMAAPPRKAHAARENRPFITLDPKPGLVALWESWLRHEVPMNRADEERISVSFNYAWG
jgi:uncharacterized protein (TIGR02466 family)